jgi:hypothetical protein
MTILFSPSLNTEFDTNVTPLDQIPADAFGATKVAQNNSAVTLEVISAVEVKADVLTDAPKSNKG